MEGKAIFPSFSFFSFARSLQHFNLALFISGCLLCFTKGNKNHARFYPTEIVRVYRSLWGILLRFICRLVKIYLDFRCSLQRKVCRMEGRRGRWRNKNKTLHSLNLSPNAKHHNEILLQENGKVFDYFSVNQWNGKTFPPAAVFN